MEKREKYLEKLRGIYTSNLGKDGVQLVYGTARLANSSVTVKLFETGQEVTYSAPHILIATGGHAIKDPSVTNGDWGTTSDGFFALKEQPKKAAIIGAGYIAVEIAGMLQGLGTPVTLFTRHETVLR